MDISERISRHGPSGAVRGVVVLLHGGSGDATGVRDVGSWNPAYKRMSYLHWCIRNEMKSHGLALWVLRFRHFNWATDPGAPGATQVEDVRSAIGLAESLHGDVPVVLVGHSMGARVAVRASDSESVAGVVGLAPWWPADEPTTPIMGRQLAAAINPKDPVAKREEVELFAERARKDGVDVELLAFGAGGPGGQIAHSLVWNPGTLHGFIHAQTQRMIATPGRRHESGKPGTDAP